MSKKYQFALLIFSLIGLLLIMNHYAPANTLDARLSYSYGDALDYFRQLTSEQRWNYAKTESWDFLLIINYTMLLYLFMCWIFPDVRWILFFVCLPGFFDYLETVTIFLVMVTENPDFIFAELGAITALKWMSGFAVVFLSIGTRIHRQINSQLGE